MTNDIAKEILSWLSSARELLAEQAPLLVQEIILWGIWGNLLIAVALLGVIALTFALKLGPKIAAWQATLASENYGDPEMATVTQVGLVGIRIVLGTGAFFACYWAFCAAVTPRYYLLVKLAGLAQ